MKVLDLFSGLGGWSAAFSDRGHDVVTVDIEPKFNPTICKDIRGLNPSDLAMPYWEFDVILASPPCNTFTTLTARKYWIDNKPTKEAREAIKLVEHTLSLIYDLCPRFWFLENPRGKLRTVIGDPPVTLYYSQFGEDRLKPTDIWGRHPKGFKDTHPFDKGLKQGWGLTGTIAMKRSRDRALIPYALSFYVCKLCENSL